MAIVCWDMFKQYKIYNGYLTRHLVFSVIHRKYVADVICTANLHNVWRAIIAALAML